MALDELMAEHAVPDYVRNLIKYDETEDIQKDEC